MRRPIRFPLFFGSFATIFIAMNMTADAQEEVIPAASSRPLPTLKKLNAQPDQEAFELSIRFVEMPSRKANSFFETHFTPDKIKSSYVPKFDEKPATAIAHDSGNVVTSQSRLVINYPTIYGQFDSIQQPEIPAWLKAQEDVEIWMAPRIILLENQEATVTQGKQRPFVVDVESVDAGNGTKVLKPVLQVIDEGLSMSFIVSRKDSQLKLQSKIVRNEISEITDYTFPATEKAGGSIQIPHCKSHQTEIVESLEQGTTLVVDANIVRTIENRKTSNVPVIKNIPIIRGMTEQVSVVSTEQRTLIFITITPKEAIATDKKTIENAVSAK